MAYTDIDKPEDYFQTKLYTGDDTNNRQISLNFSPDWTWLKSRSQAYSHIVYDRVRGVGNRLNTNGTTAESDGTDLSWTNSGCTTNSFTVDRGTNESQNETGTTFTSWNWLAGGTASSNTDGSITSNVSANTTSGFSVVSFTGNATAGATVGHGLGVVPKMIILKSRNSTDLWFVQHTSLGATKFLRLNDTNASTTQTNVWNDTEPTSSVFSLGNGSGTNGSSNNFIAYCFSEKKGFSKFGSYTGNGNADGTFVYTGFKPAFLILKRTDSSADWFLHDNKRNGFNPDNDYLQPNLSSAETNFDNLVDFVSNGWKIRDATTAYNASGGSYIYMCFAESPFTTSTGIPTTAR